jgi:hypothetical protein
MALRSPSYNETNLVGLIVQSAVTTTATTIYAQFTDSKTGAARTPQSSTKYFTIDKDSSKFEIIKASSHSTASGVTTITVDTNGRALPLFGTGNGSGTGTAHPIGAQIGCVDIHWAIEIHNKWMDGTEGSSATSLRIGDETDSNVTVYAQNADANKPFIRYSASDNKWLISNDGTSTYDPQAGGSGVTAGNGLSLAAGVLSVNVADTAIFVNTSSGAGDSGKIPRLNASGKLVSGFITSAALATYISDVTSTATEINKLSGTSANVTATNLNTLTAGASSNADSLHSHTNPTISLTSYEAITAGNAVCLLPIEVEYYAQLTDANLALGDSNVRRRYAVKIIPTVTTSTLTTMQFRAAEAVNGATTLGNLTISIQTDSSGAPSGTAISNGTADVITQATQRTWTNTMATRTATWSAAPTLTAGTTYWIVWEVAATDATNYLNLSVNSSHDESYLTFTRLTYNLDTTSWGSSTTNATPFFWFNSQVKLLGLAVAPTDADWGGRTWSFIGFAKTTVAANAAVDVYYDIVPGQSGLTAGTAYYLSGTAGAITTTKPSSRYEATTWSYQIGRAINSTTLKIKTGAKILWAQGGASSTTTLQFITWFKPELIEVIGSQGKTGAYSYVTNGIYDGVSNYSVTDKITASTHASVGDSNSSWGSDQHAGEYIESVGSAISDAGFTYTHTETGTIEGHYMIKMIG